MSRTEAAPCLSITAIHRDSQTLHSPREIMEKMDVFKLFGVAVERLPFSLGDTTAGGEAELQAVVVGRKENVDLPITIQQSHYFANMTRRTAAGELPNRAVTDLEKYLDENADGVWESSWVRFPRATLGTFAQQVFQNDLLADKTDPAQGQRTDTACFLFQQDGQEYVRIPISYLLKIALADVIDGQSPTIAATGQKLMDHFLSDNTSPETFSFHVSPSSPETGMGKALACRDGETFSSDATPHPVCQRAASAWRTADSGPWFSIPRTRRSGRSASTPASPTPSTGSFS